MPKKITLEYLENSSLYYLSRFATSKNNLKQVMMRKILWSARYHGTNSEEGKKLIEGLIDRYLRSGLLNDKVYAQNSAVKLHQQGNSSIKIRAKLKKKGVCNKDIEDALSSLEKIDENPELAAAILYARRKCLGPFQISRLDDSTREKQLAKMARAGFSYKISNFIIFAKNKEELL